MDFFEQFMRMPTLREVEEHSQKQKEVEQARATQRGYFGPEAMRYPNSASPIRNGALYDAGRALENFDVPIASGLGRYMRGVATGEKMGPMDYLGASLDLPVPLAMAGKPAAAGARALAKKLPEWMSNKAGPRAITRMTRKQGGASVHAATGEIPADGFMVSTYPKRSVVVDGPVKEADVASFLAKNKDVLKRPDNFLGTWYEEATGKTHLDISKRFTDKRKAFKTAERHNQLAIYDVATGKSPEAPQKWEKWARGPEFSGRLDEMFKLGDDTMTKAGQPADWWEISGPDNPWERIYGAGTHDQRAGFLASTAPSSPLKQNTQAATEYMRRTVKGEPTIQPDWRSPLRGNKMPMETNRARNLEHARAGNLGALRSDKVRNEGLAIAGDPNAMVFDTHWSKLGEVPSQNLYMGPDANRIPDEAYGVLEDIVMTQAKQRGITPSEFAAKVWTGIREQMKTGTLFGEKVRKSTGSSMGYTHQLEVLIKEEAERRGATVADIEARLSKGDMSLFPAIFAPFAGLTGVDFGGEYNANQ